MENSSVKPSSRKGSVKQFVRRTVHRIVLGRTIYLYIDI
nr:MAG TPA: hypothetical protein [Caudoviricetes sp.]